MNENIVENEKVSVVDTESVSPPENTPSVDELNAKIAELNDKYLRMAAELENTRRRATLDSDAAARNRAMGVARHFLPVIDAIAAAMEHTPGDDGIIAMSRAMDAALTQIGIVKIETVGKMLNPQFHNAIQAIDAPETDEKKSEPNTIVQEMQSGYMFGDTVLRPAMVIVAK
ncbi:MAG: nucleotide exchange factor GrpE [Alphaproteobacteria bacterium]|nr:nucleotide exchange factor GrpE [Alphaproteobacteria bacterium]